MAIQIKGPEILENDNCTITISESSTVTVRHFTGTQEEIEDKMQELAEAGYTDFKITTGATWKLDATLTSEATDPDTGEPPDPEDSPTWELVPTTFEQSLYEMGRPLVENLPTGVKEMIENKIKNPNQPTVFGIPPTVSFSGALVTKHDTIYAMRRMGIEGRTNFYWTLRRTITIASDYENLTWTINNVLKVLSTEKVKALYNVPVAYGRLMPASSAANELQSFSEATSPIYVPFYYGWLEQPPHIQTVGDGRSQVSQAWVYNKWNVTNGGLLGSYDLVA
jgi:hypothetical protein